MNKNAMNPESLDIQIPPRKEYLSLIRHFVSQVIVTENPLFQDRLEAIQLCVSEAVTNSIQAHENAQNQEPISVRLFIFDDHIDIEIQDKGCGFDLEKLEEGRPEKGKLEKGKLEKPETYDSSRNTDLKEKGHGLIIMREHVDVCEIKSSTSGTNVRLSVYPEDPAQ